MIRFIPAVSCFPGRNFVTLDIDAPFEFSGNVDDGRAVLPRRPFGDPIRKRAYEMASPALSHMKGSANVRFYLKRALAERPALTGLTSANTHYRKLCHRPRRDRVTVQEPQESRAMSPRLGGLRPAADGFQAKARGRPRADLVPCSATKRLHYRSDGSRGDACDRAAP